MRPRAAALAILMALPACGQSNPSSSGLPDDYSGSDAGAPGASAGNPCATPNEGCRCEAYGAVIDCGQVERRSGKFVSCSLGKRTCSGGRWGACIGDRISGQVEAPLPGKSPLALGNQSACLNNPCDPYCVNYVDNASDLDGGDNLTVVDGSLVLIQHEGGTSFTTCTGLVITPGPQTITVVGISPLVTVPDSVAFAAKLSPVGCVKGTVPATWAISNEDIAAIASDGTVKLYVPVAANLTVTGYAGSWVATTTASVVVSVQDKSLVPAATAALFDGTVSGVDTATVLYPYARTVFPRAIKAPVVQWATGGSTADAVKYFVRYPTTGTPIFSWSSIITEPATPNAVIPAAVWSALDQTAKGADATIGIQRVIGGQLRPEISRPIHFSIAPLRGQIYYTEYGRAGINPPPALGASCSFSLNGSVIRSLDPTGSSAPVNPFATVAPGGCPVCHSVSANGRMFVTSDRGWGAGGGVSRINTDGTFTQIANAPQPPKPGVDSRGFSFAAITPDGQYVLQGSNLWGNTNAGGIVVAARLSAGNGNGLYADYFANVALSGSPAKHRIDTTIDFSWAAGTPDPAIPAGGYSARWTGQVQPYSTETYTFEVESSDGARLYVNGQLIIDSWVNQNPALKKTGTFAGTAGQKYDIDLQYYESTGAAVAKLRWSASQAALEIIPETQLYAR
jgi:PA14 domain